MADEFLDAVDGDLAGLAGERPRLRDLTASIGARRGTLTGAMVEALVRQRQGYPIGTGQIEGACGDVVRDRMENSGMRWSIAGAEAILQRRAVKQRGLARFLVLSQRHRARSPIPGNLRTRRIVL